MRNLIVVLLCLLGCVSTATLNAQDIHFSHIHASPILLNPAMTGLFNGDVRLTANGRSQWNSVTKGYRTAAAAAELRLANIGRHDVFSGGIQVFNDKAGDLDFTTNSVSMSFAYLKSIDDGSNFISIGLQNSFVSNSVDYSKIVAFDYEPSVMDGAPNKIKYWDVSAGLNWFYTYDRNTSAYLGVSLYHINRPVVSFFEIDELEEGMSLYRKVVIHGGGDFELSRRSTLKPSFIIKDQGPHRELTLGTFWKYRTKKRSRYSDESALYFGAWFRWYAEKDLMGTDAVVASVRYDFERTFITFSFDLNISKWTSASSGRGGPELSFIKILDVNRRTRKSTKVICPSF